MKTLTVANLKSQFSNVVKDLRQGKEITIEYGKSHDKLGVIVPYEKYKPTKRKLGILENKASYEIISDFKITNEDLLSS